MSYILDALRKSEQQRQATHPSAITDRLLVSPKQTTKKSNFWLKALLLTNILFLLSFGSFFLLKKSRENHSTPTIQLNGSSVKSDSQLAKKGNTNINDVDQFHNFRQSDLPNISELVESKKVTDAQRYRQIPNQQKEAVNKRKSSTKKKAANVEISEEQPATNDRVIDSYREKPQPLVAKQKPVNIKELPYQERNGLPNMNINVFSYAHKPEDRFVIIDMVKYKPGQYIKGSVKLKEILEDSIVVEDGTKTFKVERP